MALSPKDRAQLKEHQRERAEHLERIEFLDRLIALYHTQEAKESDGDESPQLALHSPVVTEEPKDMSIRASIRRVLREAAGSRSAPDITNALLALGIVTEYKRGKDNVDTTLKRMKVRGEVQRTDDGWKLAS